MFNTMKKMAMVMAAMMSMSTVADAAPVVRVSVGPPAVQVVRPPMPHVGYVWVGPSWFVNAHGIRVQRAGYWRAPARRVVVQRAPVRRATVVQRTSSRRVVHHGRSVRR